MNQASSDERHRARRRRALQAGTLSRRRRCLFQTNIIIVIITIIIVIVVLVLIVVVIAIAVAVVVVAIVFIWLTLARRSSRAVKKLRTLCRTYLNLTEALPEKLTVEFQRPRPRKIDRGASEPRSPKSFFQSLNS